MTTVHRLAFLIVAAVAVVAAVGLASCSDDSSSSSSSAALSSAVPVSSATVKITSGGFDPDAVTVPAGDAVTFTNNDNQDHRVVADDGTFDTGTLRPGESTVVVLADAGTVKFKDSLDPSLTGQVEVAASTP
jgi:plastocyanin